MNDIEQTKWNPDISILYLHCCCSWTCYCCARSGVVHGNFWTILFQKKKNGNFLEPSSCALFQFTKSMNLSYQLSSLCARQSAVKIKTQANSIRERIAVLESPIRRGSWRLCFRRGVPRWANLLSFPSPETWGLEQSPDTQLSHNKDLLATHNLHCSKWNLTTYWRTIWLLLR